jgi:hypothetical protein
LIEVVTFIGCGVLVTKKNEFWTIRMLIEPDPIATRLAKDFLIFFSKTI